MAPDRAPARPWPPTTLVCQIRSDFEDTTPTPPPRPPVRPPGDAARAGGARPRSRGVATRSHAGRPGPPAARRPSRRPSHPSSKPRRRCAAGRTRRATTEAPADFTPAAAEQEDAARAAGGRSWLTVETALYLLFFITAFITRFWDLGLKGLHHDESLHAVYSRSLLHRPGLYP